MIKKSSQVFENVSKFHRENTEQKYAMGVLLLQAYAEADINYGNYKKSNGKPCRNPEQAMKVFFDTYCEPSGIDGATIRGYGQVARKFSINDVHALGGMSHASVLAADYVTDDQRKEYITRANAGEKWSVKDLNELVGRSVYTKVDMFSFNPINFI